MPVYYRVMFTLTDDTPVRARKLKISGTQLHYTLVLGEEPNTTVLEGSIDKPQGSMLNPEGRAWVQLQGFVMLGFSSADGTPKMGFAGPIAFRALPPLAKTIITQRLGGTSP